MNGLRAGPLLVAAAALAALCAPLAGGRWELLPRGALAPISLPPSRASLGVPEVPAPFRVEQRDLQGALVWRLRAEGTRSSSFEEHELSAPRCELFRAGLQAGELTAARGTLVLDREAETAALALEGGVAWTASGARARTERVELGLAGSRDAPDVQVRVPGALTGEVAHAGGPALEVRAAGLRGPLLPRADLLLVGPVELESGPLVAPVELAGRALVGRAPGGVHVRTAAVSSATASGQAPPWALELEAAPLALADPQDPATRLDAARALVRLRRLSPAAAALGATAGVGPRGPLLGAGNAVYALEVCEGRDVRGALSRARAGGGREDAALAARDVRVDFDRERAVASGAPVTVDLGRQGPGGPSRARLEAPRVEAVLRGPALVLAAEGGVRAELAEPSSAAGVAPPPPWDLRAARARLEVERAALRGRELGPEHVLALEVDGGAAPLTCARRDGQGGLAARTLTYAAGPRGGEGPVEVTGPFALDLGPALSDGVTWRVAGEALHGRVRRDGVALVASAATRPPPRAAWRALLAAAEVRAPAIERREPLRPGRELDVQGERLTWDGAESVAVLDGAPARVRGAEGALHARRVLAWERARWPAPTFLVAAAGDVQADVAAVGSGKRARPTHVTAGWAVADVGRVRRPPDARGVERTGLGLGVFAAGGPDGLALAQQPRPDDPAGAALVGARAARLEGRGWERTARLVPRPGEELELVRGPVAFALTDARVRWSEPDRDGARRVDLSTDQGFRARFPARGGEATATGGALAVQLDPAHLGDEAWAPTTRARRALLGLECTGGLRLDGPGLRARADSAARQPDGSFLLRGDPARIEDEGPPASDTTANELVLRLPD